MVNSTFLDSNMIFRVSVVQIVPTKSLVHVHFSASVFKNVMITDIIKILDSTLVSEKVCFCFKLPSNVAVNITKKFCTNVFFQAIPLLKRQQNHTLTMSQEQVRKVLL